MICYASQAFFLKRPETFDITRLSTTNHRKVINAQTCPVFWTTLNTYAKNHILKQFSLIFI